MIAATSLGVGASVWFAVALIAMRWPRHRAAAARAILALAVTLGANNQIVMEDEEGKEFIFMHSPNNSTGIYMGSPSGRNMPGMVSRPNVPSSGK